jgi:cytokinesis protein
MATLFGRNKKHRSRTTSSGSDGLSSVPYASTSTPDALPIPRNSISDDYTKQPLRASIASGASSSGRPFSPPPLRDHVNMQPGNTNISRDSSDSKQSNRHHSIISNSAPSNDRSRTPDPNNDRLRRHPSSTSTDGGGSHYAGSTHTSSGSTKRPHRQMERLSEVPHEDGHRNSSITATSTSRRDTSSSSSHVRDPRTSSSSQARTDSIIPPYSPTMRSIGSSASQFTSYPYPSSSYPSSSSGPPPQQPSLRASRASTHSMTSQRSSLSLNHNKHVPPTPPVTNSEFNFPRPSSDDDVEGLFEDLLQRTDVPIRDRDAMRSWPVAKKWTMVYNDKLQDWKQARKVVHSERVTPQMPSTATMGSTPVFVEQQNPVQLSTDPNNKMRLQRGKTESPEWYLTKFMDGTIQPAIVSSLTVGLRTYEISWVETFVNKLHGLSVLTNALANISRLPVPRKEQDLRLELEIVKCLKHLLQMQVCTLALVLLYKLTGFCRIRWVWMLPCRIRKASSTYLSIYVHPVYNHGSLSWTCLHF